MPFSTLRPAATFVKPWLRRDKKNAALAGGGVIHDGLLSGA
jgi:hypothetical protein